MYIRIRGIIRLKEGRIPLPHTREVKNPAMVKELQNGGSVHELFVTETENGYIYTMVVPSEDFPECMESLFTLIKKEIPALIMYSEKSEHF